MWASATTTCLRVKSACLPTRSANALRAPWPRSSRAAKPSCLRTLGIALHILTSRGRARLLRKEGRLRTPLGYLGAYTANALRPPLARPFPGAGAVFRPALGPLPLARCDDFPSRCVPLSSENVRPSLLASCSIPFWLSAQHHLPGAPQGAYWDGGITDYHLHLDYRPLLATGAALVLYPHFQAQVVPGWLDKALKSRHKATPFLDNLVLAGAGAAAWVASLPAAKLPDRNDFLHLRRPMSASGAGEWRWPRASDWPNAFDLMQRRDSLEGAAALECAAFPL